MRQVLNVNAGTVLAAYLLYRLGIDIEFKISVFTGNDNPFSALWTLLAAALFSRDDGSTPLVGFNWSNSVDNQTIHITETWKSIVRQPYDRRAELLELAPRVANLSAKHEGGDPETDRTRAHPSDILDCFRDKEEVIASGDWEALQIDFLDKCEAGEHTARALTERGVALVAAGNLHGCAEEER